jgi:hypothetical protein
MPNHFLRFSKASIEHLVETKDAYQLAARDISGREVTFSIPQKSIDKQAGNALDKDRVQVAGREAK